MLPGSAGGPVSTAPAPRMLPVLGKPGIGTAVILNDVIVGDADADAAAKSPTTVMPSRAIRPDVLRKVAMVMTSLQSGQRSVDAYIRGVPPHKGFSCARH